MIQNHEEWERLLSAAAELQHLIPGCVLVGGSAAAIHAKHRLSMDADHVLTDLENRFDDLLAFLEKHREWKTARIQPPKLILGNFFGVETGLRQLIRSQPLETESVELSGKTLTIPTKAEMLRIKAWLIVIRNATRDFIDFAAISNILGDRKVVDVLKKFDHYYHDAYRGNEVSPLNQLSRQLAEPKPYDLDDIDIARYKGIAPPLDRWEAISGICNRVSALLSDTLTE
jgi:hypothetical protein